jgi:hypothetical protein
MKKVAKLLLVLSVIAVGLAGCSKEKRIERHLYRKDGKWNNTLYEYKYIEGGSVTYSEVYANAGYIEFDKNGSYVWTFISDGDSDVEAGTWTNTEDQLTMISNSVALQFKILEESKKEMKLEYTEYNGSDTEVYTLTLEKAK